MAIFYVRCPLNHWMQHHTSPSTMVGEQALELQLLSPSRLVQMLSPIAALRSARRPLCINTWLTNLIASFVLADAWIRPLQHTLACSSKVGGQR